LRRRVCVVVLVAIVGSSRRTTVPRALDKVPTRY
jgi:hypothetical protein